MLFNMIIFKVEIICADGFIKTIHLVAHSKGVFDGLKVNIQNQFPCGENEWDIYLRKLTIRQLDGAIDKSESRINMV